MNPKKPLFTKIDCLRLYVPDLEKGIEFYHKHLGLPLGWRTGTAIGFLMGDGAGELVIQNEDKQEETDPEVESVKNAIESILYKETENLRNYIQLLKEIHELRSDVDEEFNNNLKKFIFFF